MTPTPTLSVKKTAKALFDKAKEMFPGYEISMEFTTLPNVTCVRIKHHLVQETDWICVVELTEYWTSDNDQQAIHPASTTKVIASYLTLFDQAIALGLLDSVRLASSDE